jgi:hypothetical protein
MLIIIMIMIKLVILLSLTKDKYSREIKGIVVIEVMVVIKVIEVIGEEEARKIEITIIIKIM